MHSALSTDECPSEALVLLDHAIDCGLELRQWPSGGEFTHPHPSLHRYGSMVACPHPTWTVLVQKAGVRGGYLEWREDEGRWVGFGMRLGEHSSSRFYEGPQDKAK